MMGGDGARHVPTGVQVRDIELTRSAAQVRPQAAREEKLQMVGQAIREIRKNARFDAVRGVNADA